MDPILIVDDEKDNLDALSRLLRDEFKVVCTTSPFEALKRVQQERFHVVVSDQRMPEMSGVELLEKIKSVRPNVTRILLTGYTDIDSVIDAINRGNIYRYIAKPWDPEDLGLTLRQANEAFKLRTQLEEQNVKLQLAFSELQVLDQAKARFLGLVSHELKTPVTVLASFCSLLTSQKDTLPTDVQRSIAAVAGASDRLATIVDEVLSYLKVETAGMNRENTLVLGQLVHDAKASVIRQMQKKKIKWIELHPNQSLVSGDGNLLRLGLAKMLEDAIERSPESGSITLRYSEDALGVALQIDRQGEMVTDAVLQPLEMAGPELNHHRNLGLNLATARAVMLRHGATLEVVTSTAQQTAVRVVFPKMV